MKEPTRLRDDPNAATELRSLLGRAPRAKPLDAVTRQRIGRRLDRFLALPLVLTLGLTMKTAAASFAVTAGALTVGTVVIHEVRALSSLSEPLQSPSATSLRLSRAQAPSVATAPALSNVPVTPGTDAVAAFPDNADAEEQLAAVTARVPSHAASKPGIQAGGSGANTQGKTADSDGLEQEAAMLEIARRALRSSPAEALAIVDEHRTKFPRATLGLEREFIRLDALYRLGRHAEARHIAETLQQRGGLYAERVQRLIEKLDNK